MRVHMAVQPRLAPLGDRFLYVARRNTFAQLRQNNASSSVPYRPRKGSSQCSINPRPTALRPIGKRRSFAAFAHHPDLTAFEIEVFDIQVDQFGQTQSAP